MWHLVGLVVWSGEDKASSAIETLRYCRCCNYGMLTKENFSHQSGLGENLQNTKYYILSLKARHGATWCEICSAGFLVSIYCDHSCLYYGFFLWNKNDYPEILCLGNMEVFVIVVIGDGGAVVMVCSACVRACVCVWGVYSEEIFVSKCWNW